MVEDSLCYICYEAESKQMSYAENLCACKGTLRIHIECLQRMITCTKWCMTCKTPYQLPKRYRGGLPLIIGIDENEMRYVYTIDHDSNTGEIHGLHQNFTLEGTLTECSVVDHGERNGLYQEWYDSGHLHFQVQYDHNGKFGDCKSWNKEGALAYKIHICKDKATGLGRTWESSMSNHNPYLRSIMYYMNHQGNGLTQEFYGNNQIASESTSMDGMTIGRHKRWNKNGEFYDVRCMKQGKKIGLYMSYDTDGNISDCVYYKENEKVGLMQIFVKGRLMVEKVIDEKQENILEDITDIY